MVAAAFYLPAFSESLSAGFPSPAEGYEDEPLNLHDWLVRNPAATFFFRVEGDTLRHDHIRDGSILVVDRSAKPAAGRLIVAEVDGAFAIIRFVPGVPILFCGVVVAAVTRFL